MSGEHTAREIKAVLFDLDGVLIDSGGDITNAVNWILSKYGYPPLAYDIVKRHIGHGAAALLRSCFGEFGSELEKTSLEALPTFKSYYLEHSTDETTLYSEVSEGLDRLERSGLVKMAVVTNKPFALAEKVLFDLGVGSKFETIVAPEQLTRLKPDPEGLLLALARLGYAPAEAAMVGDSWSDIEAGKRAGTKTIAVLWGIGDPAQLKKSGPDWLASSFSQLVEVILPKGLY